MVLVDRADKAAITLPPAVVAWGPPADKAARAALLVQVVLAAHPAAREPEVLAAMVGWVVVVPLVPPEQIVQPVHPLACRAG